VKIDAAYVSGIFGIVIGSIVLFFGITFWLAERISELLGRISAALSLLPTCHFDPEREKRISDILLLAQKKLAIGGNYPDAASLFNSVTNDMWSCKLVLWADPWLMLFAISGLLIILGIITIIRHDREIRGSKKPQRS